MPRKKIYRRTKTTDKYGNVSITKTLSNPFTGRTRIIYKNPKSKYGKSKEVFTNIAGEGKQKEKLKYSGVPFKAKSKRVHSALRMNIKTKGKTTYKDPLYGKITKKDRTKKPKSSYRTTKPKSFYGSGGIIQHD